MVVGNKEEVLNDFWSTLVFGLNRNVRRKETSGIMILLKAERVNLLRFPHTFSATLAGDYVTVILSFTLLYM